MLFLRSYLLFFVYISYLMIGHCSPVESSCMKLFTSSGAFEAPGRNHYQTFSGFIDDESSDLNRSSHKPLHCIYKFVGKEDERVALNFTSFQLRGDEPECNQEYVDIFVELKSDQDLEQVIGTESSNGRFCSSVVPRRFVSLHNMILMIIHSNYLYPGKPLFTGNYEFIRSKSYDQIGQPETGTLCSHTIIATEKREGEFQSLTYPGFYVKGLKCSYKFIGRHKQRVRLEFLDLDLYSGGSHCPMDSIKIFDGLEETDPIINTICGSHQSLIIYSRNQHLLVTFTTIKRESEIQNRGFSAYFEFSDKFVDPSFIKHSPNLKHIRGSECDQRIISTRVSTGIVTSPELGQHSNAICRYIFEGLQTALDYERVVLRFREFDLKSASNLTSGSSGPEQCNDNYVRIYTGEQKPDQKQDPNDYDYVFCGNELPQPVESDAASLLMEYNSGSNVGRFVIEYKFVVDFRIPGIQNNSNCNYNYRSDFMRMGTFNSPRHPSWYINDINCSYTFITKPNEVLLIQFNTFKMSNSFDEKILGYNEICRGHDSAEIAEVTLENQLDFKVVDSYQIGTYCGVTTPGPILTYKPLRVNFMTNKDKVDYGFSAMYNFFQIHDLTTNEFVTNCGGIIQANHSNKSGTISSPGTYRPETYEKRNHICSWNITSRVGRRIALDFNRFELEGSPYVRGCITASVRIRVSHSKLPIELCGTMTIQNKSDHQYVSDSEWLSLTFISTKQASGSNGFLATWMEVLN